jgi:hypothetical protein
MSKIFSDTEFPTQLKIFKNDVWLTTQLNVFKLKGDIFQVQGPTDGMMSQEYVKIFSVSNGMWFSDSGMWGFQE